LGGSNFFYYYAIAKTTVATAIIVQYTAPVWVLLYMVFRGRQHATAKRTGSVLLAVAGAAMAIGVFSGAPLRAQGLGIVASLGAAFSFSFYNVYGHDVLKTNPQWKVITHSLLGASIFWLIVHPPNKIYAAHYSPQQWLFLFLFSLVSMLAPFSFYFA